MSRTDQGPGTAVRFLKALNPWTVTSGLYRRAGAARSELLERLSFWRSVAGITVLAILQLSFVQDPYAATLNEIVSALVVNSGIAFGVMLLAVFAIYFFTAPPFRWQLLPGARRLGRNIALFAGTIGAPIVLLNIGSGYIGGVDFELFPPLLLPVLIPPIIVLAAWYFAYLFLTLYWTARTIFWAGDVHPALAPLGAVVLTIGAAVNEFAYYDSGDEIPIDAWLTFLALGTTTTLVLAALEYRCIRRLRIGLTTGPRPYLR